MAILTKSGRTAIATSIKAQPIHLAWGTGEPDWQKDTTPPEPIEATSLLKEIGRRVADEVIFCKKDADGDLVTPTGRFKASKTPTNNLFLRFSFDFENAADQTIKELGVMIGAKTSSKLPGQRYFEAAEITDAGALLVLERIPPIIRTPATRETFSFVITF